MTAKKMKVIDLKRWNLLQLHLMQKMGIPLDPDHVMEFAKWFSNEVDNLGRLPRLEEVRAHAEEPEPKSPDRPARKK